MTLMMALGMVYRSHCLVYKVPMSAGKLLLSVKMYPLNGLDNVSLLNLSYAKLPVKP